MNVWNRQFFQRFSSQLFNIRFAFEPELASLRTKTSCPLPALWHGERGAASQARDFHPGCFVQRKTLLRAELSKRRLFKRQHHQFVALNAASWMPIFDAFSGAKTLLSAGSSTFINRETLAASHALRLNRTVMAFSRTKARSDSRRMGGERLATSLAVYATGLASRLLTIAGGRAVRQIGFLCDKLPASPTGAKRGRTLIGKITGLAAKLARVWSAARHLIGLAAIPASDDLFDRHKTPLTRVADILKGARDVSNRACRVVDQTALAHEGL